MLANGRIWWGERTDAVPLYKCSSAFFTVSSISFPFTYPPSYHSSNAVRLLRNRQDEGNVCRGAPLAFLHQSWWTSSEKNLHMSRDKGERWSSTGKLRSLICKCFITLKDTFFYTVPLFPISLLALRQGRVRRWRLERRPLSHSLSLVSFKLTSVSRGWMRERRRSVSVWKLRY